MRSYKLIRGKMVLTPLLISVFSAHFVRLSLIPIAFRALLSQHNPIVFYVTIAFKRKLVHQKSKSKVRVFSV